MGRRLHAHKAPGRGSEDTRDKGCEATARRMGRGATRGRGQLFVVWQVGSRRSGVRISSAPHGLTEYEPPLPRPWRAAAAGLSPTLWPSSQTPAKRCRRTLPPGATGRRVPRPGSRGSSASLDGRWGYLLESRCWSGYTRSPVPGGKVPLQPTSYDAREPADPRSRATTARR